MRIKLKPLDQQTIVITGASSGIGLATACAAARRGANLVLVARNGEALDEVANDLRARGGRVATCTLDVGNAGWAETVAAAAGDKFGGFDTWVNCAAVTSYGTLEQLGVHEHRRVFNVDYFALLEANLVASRHLRDGGGAIINLGSVLSDRSLIKQPAYSAAKAAVRALTESLRMDLERDGLPISVTLIKPSGIHTPFPEHGRNHMEEPPRIPQVIYGPELVAEAILFAAEHPRRQIYVGGFGFTLSLLSRLFPRTTDRIMELALVSGQQAPPDEPGDAAMRDNLFQPREDASIEGTQDFQVRRQSLFLEAQKRPLLASGLLAGAAVAAGALLRRKRGSQSER